MRVDDDDDEEEEEVSCHLYVAGDASTKRVGGIGGGPWIRYVLVAR